MLIPVKMAIILQGNGGYIGPGDFAPTGAFAWCSSARAFSAAYARSRGPVMTIADGSGNHSTVIYCKRNGLVDVQQILNWMGAYGSTVCVTQAWDQTGNGNHFTQATIGNQPRLTLNALNGLPAFTGTSAASTFMATAGTLNSAAWTMYGVAERTANFTNPGGIVGCAAAFTIFIAFGSVANSGYYQNQNHTVSGVADNAFHFLANMEGIGNYTDGALDTTFTASTYNSVPRIMRTGNTTASMDGNFMEGGFWSISTVDYANLNRNAKKYLNF